MESNIHAPVLLNLLNSLFPDSFNIFNNMNTHIRSSLKWYFWSLTHISLVPRVIWCLKYYFMSHGYDVSNHVTWYNGAWLFGGDVRTSSNSHDWAVKSNWLQWSKWQKVHLYLYYMTWLQNTPIPFVCLCVSRRFARIKYCSQRTHFWLECCSLFLSCDNLEMETIIEVDSRVIRNKQHIKTCL